MSRRRRGIYGRTMHYLSTGFGAVMWWLRVVVTYPVYVVTDAFHALFGSSRPGRSGGSFFAGLLDGILTIPSLIWHYTYVGAVTLFDMALAWPRVMRLRDLAAGLPALAALASVIVTFFFLPDIVNSKQDNINGYQNALQTSADAVQEEKDPELRKALHEKMLLYLRALSQFQPEDKNYKFGIARVYYLLGEFERGEAMMSRLAPRYSPGFGKAHMWMAEKLLTQAPVEKAFDDARAHLIWALQDAGQNQASQREIRFVLGKLYYEMYKGYRPHSSEIQLTPESLLNLAEESLKEAAPENPEVQLMMGRIHALQGRKEQAIRDIANLAAGYKAILKTKPDDVDTRVRLAQAYRDIGEFGPAIQTLQDGIVLRPEPRLHFELSTTFFLMAADQERNVPNSLDSQFAALRFGYQAYPSNPFVAARFLQGLVGKKEGEAELARKTLADLLQAPGEKSESARGMASFLLGFDAERRSVMVDARRYLDEARKIKDDKVANALASLALANLQRRSEMLDIQTAARLTDAALEVWPGNGNLHMVRGWNDLQHKRYATALDSLNKALPGRPDDPVLHSMIEQAYRALGQTVNADRHKKLAEAAKVREFESQRTKAAQPIVIPAPPGR